MVITKNNFKNIPDGVFETGYIPVDKRTGRCVLTKSNSKHYIRGKYYAIKKDKNWYIKYESEVGNGIVKYSIAKVLVNMTESAYKLYNKKLYNDN